MMRGLISMAIVAGLLILAVSFGCGPGKKTEPAPPSGTAGSTPPAGSGPSSPATDMSAGGSENLSVSYPEGSMAPPVTSAGGTTVAGSWPADVPVMDGFGSVASTSTSGIMMLRASGNVKAEDASEFYQKLEGWSLQEGSTVQKDASGAIVFAMVKEDKILQVRITETASTTMLDLTCMPKQ